MRAADGQAAIEAIAGAAVILLVGVLVLQIVAIIAVAGAAQDDVRDAALRVAGEGELRVLTRERSAPSPLPGLPEIPLAAQAAAR